MKKTTLLLAHLLARHAYLWAALGLLAALAFEPQPAQAAVTEAWVQRYTNGEGRALVVDGSGNVVVTGYSATIKYLADGTGVWTNVWTNNTRATALAVDGSGNVVVTGFSYDSGEISRYYTAKYAAVDGALLWEKRYNGPTNSSDIALALVVDGSGNVVVTGSSYKGIDSYTGDYYTAQVCGGGWRAALGATLHQRRCRPGGGIGR